jgi:hypothetical protein
MTPRHSVSFDPAPTPQRSGDRAARVLVALVAAVLLGIALWPTLAEQASPTAPDPTWAELAPPAEMTMPTWRWLVVSGVARQAHLRISPSHADAARVEALSAWRLQRPVPGYPPDALVISIVGNDDAVERRTAALAGELLRRIPTLSIARLGVDRLGAPAGFDQEHLRFLVRERLGR